MSRSLARTEALPCKIRKGESKRAWAQRVIDTWFRIGQPPLDGNAREQVELAYHLLGMPSVYGPGQEMGRTDGPHKPPKPHR